VTGVEEVIGNCLSDVYKILPDFRNCEENIVSTFINFKKAFDSIDRGKMHEILRHYGIPPKITIMISHYDLI